MARVRRVKDEGSIYQRASDGRWVGSIDLGIIDGKRVRKTVTAATLKELRPKFDALKETTGAGVDDEALTVEKWMHQWLEDVVSERNRESTAITYEGYVKKWINPHLGKTRLSKLRADQIRKMLRAMSDDGRTDATRRQVHAILRRALKVAVQDQLIVRNPADAVDAPPVGKGSHGKYTLTQAKALLAECAKTDPPNLRWIVALLAGLRQGEALGLTWDRVDLERRRLIVNEAAQHIPGKGMIVVGVKSDSSDRAVPMVEPVWAAFNAFPEAERHGFVFKGRFEGKPLSSSRDRVKWQTFRDEVGVPKRSMHALRATCGSLLMEAGVPAKIIAEILGHSQVQITEKHYLHGDDEMLTLAMGKLGELVTPSAS